MKALRPISTFSLSTLTALTIAAGLAAAGAQAQGTDTNWYRVELMVFSQGGAAAQRRESWDPQPDLAYPEGARFLIYPERVRQREAAHPDGASDIDPRGRQIIDLAAAGKPPATDIPHRDTPAGTPPAEAATDSPGAGTPAAGTPASDEVPTASKVPTANKVPTADKVPPPALPDPFVVRPAGEQQFRGKAAYMERHGSYRILFHETWLQPVAGASRARAIVLDDSGSTAAYPALQGSVRLYAERYLHLETDLWLNTDGSYLPEGWRMPAPPLAPASLVIEEPVTLPDSAPALPAGETPAGPGAFVPYNAGDGNAADTTASPTYPYRHAIPLKASRRMRSGEVHYIDHPALGVVVKLTPLSAENLAELALLSGGPEGTAPASTGQGE